MTGNPEAAQIVDAFRTLLCSTAGIKTAVRADRPMAGAFSRALRSKQLDELVDREIRIPDNGA